MYSIYKVRDTVRVPPKILGGDISESVLNMVQEEYEGIVDDDMGVVLAVTSVKTTGEGKIILGDAGVYYDAELEILAYRPVLHEVVKGFVSEITEFGVFVRTGPVEGLVHVSQIMDDFINYDPKLPGFIGKQTNKRITMNDNVLVRTVTSSLKGSISTSKVGYTMRQLGLGKSDWMKIDESAKKKKAKGKAGSKEKKSKSAKNR